MMRLETDRLRLRDVVEDDLDFLCEIYATRRGVPDFPFVDTREQVEERIAKAQRLAEGPTGLWLAERRSDGVPVGRYGVLKQTVTPWPDGDAFDIVEVGWYTHPDHRQQGYALEAAKACRELAYERFAPPSVRALVLPQNAPSAAVATALGMRPAGRVRHADLEHTLFSDGGPGAGS